MPPRLNRLKIKINEMFHVETVKGEKEDTADSLMTL